MRSHSIGRLAVALGISLLSTIAASAQTRPTITSPSTATFTVGTLGSFTVATAPGLWQPPALPASVPALGTPAA
jgi:hypothetical protein